MYIQEQARKMKRQAAESAALSAEKRNSALRCIAETLENERERIFAANSLDLENAKKQQISDALYKRLRFDADKLQDLLAGIQNLIELPDPLGKVQIFRELDEGLVLRRESCPIGLIGVVFEARPDALVQIAALCIKSGNCVILKGGSEALHSNRLLFALLQNAVLRAGLPENMLYLAEAREEIDALLSCHDSVDLLIPRGSAAFVSYIMSHSKIPVMGHAAGICHIYVDAAADIQKAIPLIIDSKTQYAAACNAAETLLVHESIAPVFLPALKRALDEAAVTLKGDEPSRSFIDCLPVCEADFDTEYSDKILNLKLVKDITEAVEHINIHGSHHTDAILTEDAKAATYFQNHVDSAGVYHNASTRFADGFRYGFGAEVGISTAKLHARGPVGLEGLCTYKYKLSGQGHIVADYASGARQFRFRDLH